MAEIRKNVFLLSSGRQIRMFGNSIGIGKTLEIAEGYVPNILSLNQHSEEEEIGTINNPFRLNVEDIIELADYNIRLWMDLKDNVRKHGLNSTKIFIKGG